MVTLVSKNKTFQTSNKILFQSKVIVLNVMKDKKYIN